MNWTTRVLSAMDKTARTYNCWACKRRLAQEHLCPVCGKMQPLRDGSDYFEFLDMPRNLGFDEKRLQESFYSLSRKFHPDYFQTKSPEERGFSLDKTSYLNKAYQTLRDPERRALYLFNLEGIEPETDIRTSPELLSEVFEVRETIEEERKSGKAGDAVRETLNGAKARLRNKLNGIAQRMKVLFEEWDATASKPFTGEQTKRQRTAVAREVLRLVHDRNYIEGALLAIEKAGE